MKTSDMFRYSQGTKIITCTVCRIPNVADKNSISTTCSGCNQNCFDLGNGSTNSTEYLPGTKIIKCQFCNIDNVATNYSNSATCVRCGQYCF